MIKKKFLILAPLFRKKESEKPKVASEKPQETLPSIQKTEESVPKTVQKITEPIVKKTIVSEFSILATLNKKEEEEVVITPQKKEEDLPDHHFTEKDLQTEWQVFLNDLFIKDQVTYFAVNTAKLHKKEENVVEILYPSDLVKTEFEKIQAQFFNHFKRKVNNYKIEVSYREDKKLIKKQETKREIFQKYVEINPVLKDLDELMKLDLS